MSRMFNSVRSSTGLGVVYQDRKYRPLPHQRADGRFREAALHVQPLPVFVAYRWQRPSPGLAAGGSGGHVSARGAVARGSLPWEWIATAALVGDRDADGTSGWRGGDRAGYVSRGCRFYGNVPPRQVLKKV
jgi:hypothetical protein